VLGPRQLSDVSNSVAQGQCRRMLFDHLAGHLHLNRLNKVEVCCRRNVTCTPIAQTLRLDYSVSRLRMRHNTTELGSQHGESTVCGPVERVVLHTRKGCEKWRWHRVVLAAAQAQ
jgi:hypothetical protein